MNKPSKLALTISLAAVISGNVSAESYDIVINNGGVMDPETRLDGIRNVGVKNGKIYKNSL